MVKSSEAKGVSLVPLEIMSAGHAVAASAVLLTNSRTAENGNWNAAG